MWYQKSDIISRLVDTTVSQHHASEGFATHSHTGTLHTAIVGFTATERKNVMNPVAQASPRASATSATKLTQNRVSFLSSLRLTLFDSFSAKRNHMFASSGDCNLEGINAENFNR